jgi:hypothetical protein
MWPIFQSFSLTCSWFSINWTDLTTLILQYSFTRTRKTAVYQNERLKSVVFCCWKDEKRMFEKEDIQLVFWLTYKINCKWFYIIFKQCPIHQCSQKLGWTNLVWVLLSFATGITWVKQLTQGLWTTTMLQQPNSSFMSATIYVNSTRKFVYKIIERFHSFDWKRILFSQISSSVRNQRWAQARYCWRLL